MSSLSLPSVIDIVENFVQTNKDVSVTSKMIPIATDRVVRTATTDPACKMALSKLLPLLSDVIKAGIDLESTGVAFECVAKLSRVHGKAHVGHFEEIVPILVEHGVLSSREKAIHGAVDCLFFLMYVTSLIFLIVGWSWRLEFFLSFPILCR